MARVQGICLKPKEEWIKIQGESTPVKTLFLQYVIPLAAIPAAAQFIGYGLIGVRVPFFGNLRLPFGTAIVRALLTFVLTAAAAYVAGLIINALAPSFASKQNMEAAMKLAVYALTPSWIAGVLYIIPALSILVGLAGLYGLYILYLGFQAPMMETPKEKVMSYFLVSLVVMVVLWLVIGLIIGSVFALGAAPAL
ncbi:MAG: Yip1 family protein [Acidobacteriota bacterium]|nr:Yip1 family protein [Acidobacteriota bacterium]HQH45174.1 Yip1 family protein [Candidatus Aminicenantes bacterium]